MNLWQIQFVANLCLPLCNVSEFQILLSPFQICFPRNSSLNQGLTSLRGWANNTANQLGRVLPITDAEAGIPPPVRDLLRAFQQLAGQEADAWLTDPERGVQAGPAGCSGAGAGAPPPSVAERWAEMQAEEGVQSAAMDSQAPPFRLSGPAH